MPQKISTQQLPDSGVAAGSYTNTNLTVDSTGRITAASNGGSSIYFGQGDAPAATGNTIITLGSTPVSASSITVSVGGSTLRPSTAYSVSSNVVTLASALTSGQIVVTSWATANSSPGAITLSSPTPSNPSLRGTSKTLTSTSGAGTITVSLPTGTISSDLAVLFVGSQNGVTTPSGWTLQGGSAASYWAGYVFTKTLSSGDITTGSVTVTLNATSEAVGMMATIVGSSTSGVREVDVTGPVAGSSSSATMTTSSSVISTDTAVYFGSSRASAAPTVSRGTSQQTGTDGSAAAGVLTYEQLSSGGAYTTTVNYSGYNPMGYFQAVVILKH